MGAADGGDVRQAGLVEERRRDIMGALANPPWLSALAGIIGGLIIALNLFLLEQVFFG